jgi:hypothetical protein
MKSLLVITILVVVIFIASRCSTNAATNMKDLDENMLDMMVYHDNLGLYLRNKDADYALWLLNGMDSSLQVIAKKFATHRKLTDPFEAAYKKKLKPPIKGIRQALQKNDFPKAIEQYRLLTKKCNNCHEDNDINKEVQDWSLEGNH